MILFQKFFLILFYITKLQYKPPGPRGKLTKSQIKAFKSPPYVKPFFSATQMKAIQVCVNRFDDETKQAFLELYDKVDADVDLDKLED